MMTAIIQIIQGMIQTIAMLLALPNINLILSNEQLRLLDQAGKILFQVING